ncbi:hypothetical protein QS796_22185, partial [Providencia rettgeri]
TEWCHAENAGLWMGSCAAPSAKGDDKFITTDYLQQCRLKAEQAWQARKARHGRRRRWRRRHYPGLMMEVEDID